jgi:hypothetical protein
VNELRRDVNEKSGKKRLHANSVLGFYASPEETKLKKRNENDEERKM